MVKSMSKKRQDFTIAEEVLEKAKKHIPNLSNFVEECLRHYLGYADGTMPIVSDLDILDKIGKLQVDLFILNENYDAKESRKQAEEFEKDKAWRFLWNDYRAKLIADPLLLADAVKELNVNEDTLEDILDEVYENMDKLDTESWEKVYEWYNQVIK
jgi:hypothetical protein